MPEYSVERWTAVQAPNSAMLRYTLGREGYEVFQWTDRAGMIYGPHKHAEDQCHWIVSGQMEIYVKDVGAFQLGPGDRDFMPAEIWHTARVIGEEPVLYLIGIKQPLPPSKAPLKKAKQKPTAKRKPAIKKAKPHKSVTKAQKRKPSTKGAAKNVKPIKPTRKAKPKA